MFGILASFFRYLFPGHESPARPARTAPFSDDDGDEVLTALFDAGIQYSYQRSGHDFAAACARNSAESLPFPTVAEFPLSRTIDAGRVRVFCGVGHDSPRDFVADCVRRHPGSVTDPDFWFASAGMAFDADGDPHWVLVLFRPFRRSDSYVRVDTVPPFYA